MTDIQAELLRIKAHVALTEGDEFARPPIRDEVDRLTEALEAVLGEHHKGYINVRYNRSRIAQCEECQVNWPCPTVRAIEDALNEEEA